jgi:UDP-glucose 4-epimerase
MSVLVTGGAGYIGSHCVARLLRDGIDAVVVDNLSTGHEDAVPRGARLYTGDLKDHDFLRGVFSREKIDAVIHFAAFSLVPESAANPQKYFENNVGGTMCLLGAMREFMVDTLIFSSSASVYGEPIAVPIVEEHRLLPLSPYGETKLMCERIMQWYSAAYGLQYCALRYFNVAGAAPDGSIGERHKVEVHIIPNTLKVASGETEKMTISGDDYPTPDGTCIRDYIHVEDLVDAHLKALYYLKNGGASRAFNLGIGRGYSNLEILETARAVTGHPIPSAFGPRRPGDPAVSIASGSAAREILGFDPKYTLTDMVRDAWRFAKKP